MPDDRSDSAIPILDFVRENRDEMGWVSFSAIAAGTGLDPDQILDEVERLSVMGLLGFKLRWCTSEQSWSA